VDMVFTSSRVKLPKSLAFQVLLLKKWLSFQGLPIREMPSPTGDSLVALYSLVYVQQEEMKTICCNRISLNLRFPRDKSVGNLIQNLQV